MRYLFILISSILLSATISPPLVQAQYAPVISQTSATALSENPAATPTSRLEIERWATRHHVVLQNIKAADPRLIFLGDSITENWGKAGDSPESNYKAVWDKYYGDRRAFNLGFSGDTTGNVLWRIENGEIDDIHPKVAVVLIGTNNTGRTRFWPAEQTIVGMDKIIDELHQRLPDTQVLVIGILPKDSSPEKVAADQAVNEHLRKACADSRFLTFLDVSQVFTKDGKLDNSIFADPIASPPRAALHPTAQGQERMAEAMEPVLARLLGDESKGKHDSDRKLVPTNP